MVVWENLGIISYNRRANWNRCPFPIGGLMQKKWFETTPEKQEVNDRWYAKPAPLFLPKGHYCVVLFARGSACVSFVCRSWLNMHCGDWKNSRVVPKPQRCPLSSWGNGQAELCCCPIVGV